MLDHIILKVNDLDASVAFYKSILGFALEGMDGPFTVIRVNRDLVIQLAPYGTPGLEHYAFAVSADEFEAIFGRIRAAGIDHGPAFDTVGSNTGPGEETGARGLAPTLYFNDPNKHLLEIRCYASLAGSQALSAVARAVGGCGSPHRRRRQRRTARSRQPRERRLNPSTAGSSVVGAL
jgi:catechol 2,3-dioxygenase-like lactoylglutathione lyase family enzyme